MSTELKANFSHVTDWVFDLDNTLYPRRSSLFPQIDKRMTRYVMEISGLDFDAAWTLQKKYYREYGTTLRGLMENNNIDPHHFLADVHDIDYSILEPNPELGELISALPGRKHIFTNGDTPHAKNTLDALGIGHCFELIFDIVRADFVPKPEISPYLKFFEAHDIAPKSAAMFEDMPRNLEVPREHGMVTVLVTPKEDDKHSGQKWEIAGGDEVYIDHVCDDLNLFLNKLTGNTD